MRKWLVELRGTRSQYAIAKEAGIAQSTYASIETGARAPSVKTAKMIADVLNFDWSLFFKD